MGFAPKGQSRKCAAYNASFVHGAKNVIAFLQHPAVANVRLYCSNVLFRLFPHIAHSLLAESQTEIWKGHLPWLPFSGAAVNGLDGHCGCFPHRDTRDFSGGLCTVFVFGNFDADTGEGTLCLSDSIDIEICTRPGDLTFFLSSVIAHWNTPLSPGSQRELLVMFLHASYLC